MTRPAEKIMESFDALSDAEKREVIAALPFGVQTTLAPFPDVSTPLRTFGHRSALNTTADPT